MWPCQYAGFDRITNMAITLALDLYGTLFNTSGIKEELTRFTGGEELADIFARTWREKQIEYSFRRGLMRQYAPFNVCIQDALEFACFAHKLDLSETDKEYLLEIYRKLPLFADVRHSLEDLADDPAFRLFILSNGYPDDLDNLLINAGIKHFFESVVSVDEIRSFKPNPEVYEHFLKRAGSVVDETWMVSGNTFDFIGAISFGFHGAFVKRSTDILVDPWEIEPSITINSLLELKPEILCFYNKSVPNDSISIGDAD